MGRQAHLARLALGRSPFEPPQRDEHGNFILSPHAHDEGARGYRQEFNDRGHPTSKATDLQNKRLRRAQNEVMKLAGAVRSKHDEAKPDQWKSLNDGERENLLEEENDLGRVTHLLDNIVLDLTTSWIYALRCRIMTYKSYVGLPLSTILRSETRILGFRETLFSGLPLSAFVGISRRRRSLLYAYNYQRLGLLTPRSKYVSYRDSWYRRISLHLRELAWYAIELPCSACASFQMLHLIRSGTFLNRPTFGHILTLLFFDQAPKPLESLDPSAIARFCLSCLSHPLVVSYIFDQVRESLQSGIQAIIRFSLPVPDEPDAMSKRYAKGDALIYPNQTPGFGIPVMAKHRYYGPKSLSEAFRAAFPGLCKTFYALTGFPRLDKLHLTPDTEDALMKACEIHYGTLWRENRQFTIAQRLPDSVIRRTAVEEALSRAGINIAEEAISIDDWAEIALPDRSEEGSTATPDPQDLFSVTEGTNVEGTTGQMSEVLIQGQDPSFTSSGQQANTHRESSSSDAVVLDSNRQASNDQSHAVESEANPEQFQPSLPLQTLMLPITPEPQAAQNSAPRTPSPGINRAMSLDQALRRPVRRPTEIEVDHDADILAFSYRRRESSSIFQDAPQEPEDPIQHRVTFLSNFPGEVLALHASSLITSILMLPFDIYYQRTLARILLSHTEIKGPGAKRLLSDVWPVTPYLGLGGMGARGGLIIMKNLALTFGLQAVVSSCVWIGAKRFVLYFGREFGWGKV